MIYALLLMIVLSILYAIYKEKNLYNPICVFFAVWFIITLFAALRLYGMISYTNKSILIISLGLLSFFVGYLVSARKRSNANKRLEAKYNYTLIRVILIVGVLINLILSIKVLCFIFNGISYNEIRDMYYGYANATKLINNGKIFALFELVSNSILWVMIPIIIVSIFDKKSDKISTILLASMVILNLFATAGRSFLLHIMLDLIIMVLMQFSKLKQKEKKILIYCVCVIVVLLFGFTFLRNGIKSGSVPTIYSYFGIPIPLFSRFVDIIDSNKVYLHGYSSFYGLYLLIQKSFVILFKINFSNAAFLSTFNNMPGNTWVRVFQDSSSNYNAFATLFYNFYLDFSIWGVIIFSFIYGFVITKIYKTAMINKKALMVYLLLAVGLALSFIRLQFATYYIYVALVILFIVVKTYEVKNNNIDYKKMPCSNKKVSAIITTHNRVKYLKKAVNSVLKQTYKNIELIIVDDGSTDGTKEYCKSLKNVKYIYISKSKHKNGNYARNLGLKKSKCEYIAFLDDDDEWLPSKIEKQVKTIELDERIGLVYTGTTIEVNDGLFTIDNSVNLDLHGDCSKKSLYNIMTSTSTILFRRSVLDDINGWDENINYWQDNEMLISVAQKYKIEYVNENLTIYRELINDSKKISNNVDGFLNSVDYINNKYKKEISCLSKSEKVLRKQMIYNDTASRYIKVKNYKECREYLHKSFKIKPSLKSFIKYLLNYTSSRKLRLKVKIMNLRGNKK